MTGRTASSASSAHPPPATSPGHEASPCSASVAPNRSAPTPIEIPPTVAPSGPVANACGPTAIWAT